MVLDVIWSPCRPSRPRCAARSLPAIVRCRPLTEHHSSFTAARLRLHGRLTRADRERDLYAYLPFDVPPGVAAIRISLDHDAPGDAEDPTLGAALDLGYGPGHLDFGSPAFRRWIGSERRTVLVGRRQATPGYRAGSIEAGRWHIILGLYGIPATGCDYQAEVELLELELELTIEPGSITRAPTTSPAMPRAGLRPDRSRRSWRSRPWRGRRCDHQRRAGGGDGATRRITQTGPSTRRWPATARAA